MSDKTAIEPQKGETADQYKERIAETQREVKRAEAQAKADAKAAASVPVSTPAQVPAPATAGVVQPVVTEEKKPMVTGNAELDEWLAKKGPMTLENLAQSYRESEREMHRKAQEARTPGQPPVTPPVTVPPVNYPPFMYAPPAYVPPAYSPAPAQPNVSVEALAKQYGLSPEDFERVAPLVSDMARSVVDSTLSRVLPPIMNQVQGVNREVGRQKELVDLMSDPVFKVPQVQFEMDRIFKEEPNAFAAQAQPIRYAYEKALTRIARQNLGGSTGATATAPGVVPSNSRPPATAGGNGNGGGGAPSGTPQEMTPESFAGLSMAEKMEYMKSVGARH